MVLSGLRGRFRRVPRHPRQGPSIDPQPEPFRGDEVDRVRTDCFVEIVLPGTGNYRNIDRKSLHHRQAEDRKLEAEMLRAL